MGLSIVPTGSWTIEKEGTQIVPIAPIAHGDDIRQLTTVLAITTSGDDYLPASTTTILYRENT